MEVKNCRTIHTIEIGQEIYLKPQGNAKRYSGGAMIKGYVTRIARKYFYVALGIPSGSEHRFTLDGGDGMDADRTYGYIPYQSREVYDADVRYNSQMLQIRKYFTSTYSPSSWPSMEAVEQIYDILVRDGKIKEGGR